MKEETKDNGSWTVEKNVHYLKNNSASYVGGISLDFKANGAEFSTLRAEVKLNLGRPISTIRVSVGSTEREYNSRQYFFDKDFNKSSLSLGDLPQEFADQIVAAVNEVKREIGPIVQYRDSYFHRSTPEFPAYQKARTDAYRAEAGKIREEPLDISESQKSSMRK